MTAQTLSAPADPDTGPQRRSGQPTVDPRPLWRGVLLRSALVPLIVLSPLVAAQPSADHRFNVYANGARYLTRPWELVGAAVTSVPQYLNLGNFRPLGRIAEWLLDTLTFALTDVFGLPANISLRLVSFLSAILLTLAAVVLTECVTTRGRAFAGPPSLPVAVLPFAAAGGFVAAGRTSTTILFGGLYFLTAALVLLVAAAAAHLTNNTGLGVRPIVLALTLGLTLAAFNEMAWLALPLATVVVPIRARLILGRSWRDTLTGAGARFTGLLWAGFLPVAVPVRLIIAARCAAGRCYSGSDVALPGAPGALPNRLTAWIPPLMWQRASEGPYGHTLGPALLLALLAMLPLVWKLRRELPGHPAADRRQVLALAATALAVLVPAAAMGALNEQMQHLAAAGWWGLGWRDSALAGAGGALLTVAPIATLRQHRARLAAVLLLAVVAAAGASANRDYRAGTASEKPAFVHDRVAQEIVDFDRSAAGDARRCELRRQFRDSLPPGRRTGYPPELRRFDQAVDEATRELAGRRFCTGAPA
ncbi:hypothetical protein ACWT_7164 [Actinoplanes sp. SE50]|uniref:hypothetical protein n=1 Tax=unclassified Actinoplanes TaxID=2626549 RepID=UPI00023EDE4A|nr:MULTISPECIES: hypothetical protein [unclassified Actinoplanes]AEV88174.1 hypothetical protein ACPL_7294 [Actinoplanes sp. SE50/110]ATO86579.1 hypothetical protein ACWT_7164 [Actinoplanes sp. SE50]SLM03996.1 hypothetical protein ACSP50_7295 [Actinoplanes sp. SE50/110]